MFELKIEFELKRYTFELNSKKVRQRKIEKKFEESSPSIFQLIKIVEIKVPTYYL